jgi:hypothetical protein
LENLGFWILDLGCAQAHKHIHTKTWLFFSLWGKLTHLMVLEAYTSGESDCASKLTVTVSSVFPELMNDG